MGILNQVKKFYDKYVFEEKHRQSHEDLSKRMCIAEVEIKEINQKMIIIGFASILVLGCIYCARKA